MLNPRLLHYLKALNLEPLWLHKRHSFDLLETENEESTSLTNPAATEAFAATTITAPIKPTKEAKLVEVQQKAKEPSEKQLLELEINARSQFILAEQGNRTILVGFLSPNLHKAHHPFNNSNYARLLTELFQLLALSYQEAALFSRNQLTAMIKGEKIEGAILFSQAFKTSALLAELEQKHVPILLLEHPCHILRNPLIKKTIWVKLKQFLNI